MCELDSLQCVINIFVILGITGISIIIMALIYIITSLFKGN